MKNLASVIIPTFNRPKQLETTALGAAYLAGLAVGYWKDLDEVHSQWQKEIQFNPEIGQDKMAKLVNKWNKALVKAQSWIDENDEE